MRLFLMRHASARTSFPDRERVLSDEGKQDILDLCAKLDDAEFATLAKIFHSPYRRAAQTATILANQKNLLHLLESHPNLRPEDDPWQIAAELANLSDLDKDIMLVTHNPLVESLADILTSRPYSMSFSTCTLARFSLAKRPDTKNPFGKWSLDFTLSPQNNCD